LIENLKDFEKLLRLCRKAGVTKVTFQGNAVEFGELPLAAGEQAADARDPGVGLPPPTDEMLENWSVNNPQ